MPWCSEDRHICKWGYQIQHLYFFKLLRSSKILLAALFTLHLPLLMHWGGKVIDEIKFQTLWPLAWDSEMTLWWQLRGQDSGPSCRSCWWTPAPHHWEDPPATQHCPTAQPGAATWNIGSLSQSWTWWWQSRIESLQVLVLWNWTLDLDCDKIF